MRGKLLLQSGGMIAVALLCGGWSFTLADKPGSLKFTQALSARDQNNPVQAGALLRYALVQARDDETRGRILAELGGLITTSQLSDTTPSEGIALLKQAKVLGSKKADLLLGNAYQYGLGVEADNLAAIRHYQLAKEAYPQALLELAELHKGTAEAGDYFRNYLARSDSQQLSASDLLRIARAFRDGSFVAASFAEAESWYRLAIEAGSLPAVLELAALWRQENHQPSSDILKLWQQASTAGSQEATLSLAYAYEEGKLTHDPEQARHYFELAAIADPDENYRTARYYEKRDMSQALYWFRRAAELKNPKALMKLARFYRKGEGVGMDIQRARNLYQQAAAAGAPKASLELTRLEAAERKWWQQQEAQFHQQQAPSPVRDYAFWKEAAAKGNPEAMRQLGLCLMRGLGITPAPEKAISWLTRAAEAGDTPAMLSLAYAASSGEGIDYNMATAYHWFTRAAEAGDAEAQYQLGLSYARGAGIGKNIKTARHWLQLAHEKGNRLAGYLLENLGEEE